MEGSTLFFAVLVPLAFILIVSLFFYRLFSKNMKRDDLEIEKLMKLDKFKNIAEFRDARIISISPDGQSDTSPSNKYVNLRFEIKDNSG